MFADARPGRPIGLHRFEIRAESVQWQRGGLRQHRRPALNAGTGIDQLRRG